MYKTVTHALAALMKLVHKRGYSNEEYKLEIVFNDDENWTQAIVRRVDDPLQLVWDIVQTNWKEEEVVMSKCIHCGEETTGRVCVDCAERLEEEDHEYEVNANIDREYFKTEDQLIAEEYMED